MVIDETSTKVWSTDAEDPAVLNVLRERNGERLVLRVVGEADVLNARSLLDDLRSALDQRSAVVVVDLSGLTFCDLAGMDALRAFRSEAAASGVQTAVEGMSPVLSWLQDAFPRSIPPSWRAERRPGEPPDGPSGGQADDRPRAWPVR